jgi:hypothetical protein
MSSHHFGEPKRSFGWWYDVFGGTPKTARETPIVFGAEGALELLGHVGVIKCDVQWLGTAPHDARVMR